MHQLSLLLFQFIIFIILAVSCFYVPGYLLVRPLKKQLSDAEFISLSFALGFILFLVNLVIWGFVQLRIGTYIPIAVSLLWVLYIDQFKFLKPFGVIFKDKLL